MLWLLSALGFVRKALQAAFAMAMRYPREVAIVLLLVAAAWLWHGKSAATDRANACSAGRAAERASYIAAGKEAERLARAAKAAQEAKYTQLAKDADHGYETALVDAHTAADRYIASHRVRAQTAGDSRGATVASTQGGGAESGERPGAQAELVAVQADDVNICTDNTLRLEAVRTWAGSLGE